MQSRRLTAVLADIFSRPSINGTRLVGVDGPSGSGKSTVARRLAVLSGASLLEVDDFLSWGDLTQWWERFETEALAPLSEGHDATFRVRDWMNDEFGRGLGGWKTVPSAPLVVVDGVSCTRIAAADRYVFRMWVDAPEDVRLLRGLERDGEDHRKLWVQWMAMERRFFDEDRTSTRADLLVCGHPTAPHNPATELVVEGQA